MKLLLFENCEDGNGGKLTLSQGTSTLGMYTQHRNLHTLIKLYN